MKVKDLIVALQAADPERMVVVSGYEGGYHEVTNLFEQPLKLNVNTAWYYGEHDSPHDEKEVPDCVAVHLC